MKATSLFLFLFCMTLSTTAQERVQIDGNKQPFFLVDSFTTEMKYLVISPDKIESISVLKDANAVSAYGDKAKYGAVIVKTKPNTKLLQIDDILAKYNVSKADQKLRICINKTLMNRRDLILIEESEILGLEITTDRYWVNPEDANSTEKFINIKTSPKDKNGL